MTGSKGPTGAEGMDGMKGGTGAKGMTGSKGMTGAKGMTGSKGATGDKGMDGATGSVGPTGDKGMDGATGSVGPTGSKGMTGSQGPTGEGPTGPTGSKGMTGTKGMTGAKGPTGEVGPAGPAMIPIFFNSGEENFADGDYIGQGSAHGATDTNGFQRTQKIIGATGDLTDLIVHIPNGAGTGETWKISVVVDGVTQANNFCTITGAATDCQGQGTGGTWSSDVDLTDIADRITVLVESTSGAGGTPGPISATLLFEPDGS